MLTATSLSNSENEHVQLALVTMSEIERRLPVKVKSITHNYNYTIIPASAIFISNFAICSLYLFSFAFGTH